jgi:uncharacterized protein (DUF433 family)
LYLDDLTFDPDSGLASEYTPLKDNGRKIVINPSKQFGAPVVMPVGYTAGALIEAVESEGSIEAAAEAYGVDEADVKLALRYDDMLTLP